MFPGRLFRWEHYDSGELLNSLPRRGSAPRPYKINVSGMVILMEILQIYENDKIYDETPSHQDLLPGLIKLYVCGEVI